MRQLLCVHNTPTSSPYAHLTAPLVTGLCFYSENGEMMWKGKLCVRLFAHMGSYPSVSFFLNGRKGIIFLFDHLVNVRLTACMLARGRRCRVCMYSIEGTILLQSL